MVNCHYYFLSTLGVCVLWHHPCSSCWNKHMPSFEFFFFFFWLLNLDGVKLLISFYSFRVNQISVGKNLHQYTLVFISGWTSECQCIELSSLTTLFVTSNLFMYYYYQKFISFASWQVLFLMYHYFAASEIYNAIRVFIAAYVWMTGFGNFSYYYIRKDFSLARFAQVKCCFWAVSSHKFLWGVLCQWSKMLVLFLVQCRWCGG